MLLLAGGEFDLALIWGINEVTFFPLKDDYTDYFRRYVIGFLSASAAWVDGAAGFSWKEPLFDVEGEFSLISIKSFY